MSTGRVTRAAVIGSVIEYYDFVLFGLAAALVFNDEFFPSSSPLAGSLGAFAAFAVGFLVRPLGGMLFGHFGDRIGRRPVLAATVLLMGVSTAGIGLLPTYDQVGVLAPILLVALRLVQGFGAGAEYVGALVLVAESSAPRRRGLWASLPGAGVGLGILSGTLAFTVVSALPATATWAWRVPFLLSLVGVALGLYLRAGVPESALFEAERAKGVSRLPVAEVVRRHPRALLTAAAFAAPFGAASYVINVFVLSYVTKSVGLSATTALTANLAAGALSVLLTPLFGLLSDRIGRKPVFLGSAVFLGVSAFPLFWLLDTGEPVLVVAAVAVSYGVGIGGMWAVQGTLLTEMFPTRYRYTGIAVAREWAAALGSGPAPFVATALVAWAGGASWPISVLLLGCMVLACAAVARLPETRDADLAARPAETRAVAVI
ncbi:MFS transporter [Actinocorallia sp. A-T 12471]|uniref:MFS transporter n=1 Tax=Actinocorallia sp. A-T 12471 TaxID=3089813 RepID=UPI0029CB1221|nr:MFS transporter [Actinocorallia sp. A-T 12471]MDX6740408.1 MFS transporter [Actinocorallia sp. A-T 12471]